MVSAKTSLERSREFRMNRGTESSSSVSVGGTPFCSPKTARKGRSEALSFIQSSREIATLNENEVDLNLCSPLHCETKRRKLRHLDVKPVLDAGHVVDSRSECLLLRDRRQAVEEDVIQEKLERPSRDMHITVERREGGRSGMLIISWQTTNGSSTSLDNIE